jgi:hypothetical protein
MTGNAVGWANRLPRMAVEPVNAGVFCGSLGAALQALYKHG